MVNITDKDFLKFQEKVEEMEKAFRDVCSSLSTLSEQIERVFNMFAEDPEEISYKTTTMIYC